LAIAIMGGLFFAIIVNLYIMPLFFIFSIKILPVKQDYTGFADGSEK